MSRFRSWRIYFIFLVAIIIGIQKWQLLKHVYFSNNFLNESLKSMAQLKERVNCYKITKKEKRSLLFQWVLKKLVRFLWICVRTCACMSEWMGRWGWYRLWWVNLNTKVQPQLSAVTRTKLQSFKVCEVLKFSVFKTLPHHLLCMSMYIFTATCIKNFSAECQQPSQFS